MKVGPALNILIKDGHSDAVVFSERMALGDLAEPLGFDSLFALEHHFTGYAMSPSPTQLLSYYAGRTKRITLGTSVIVLPWHDPVRVAEFSFGSMPHAASEINMRLFADHVLPVLQRDTAFANYAPVAPADASAGNGQPAEDVFAPA